VQTKRSGANPTSKPFLTTGRIVKGTIASTGKRSDTEGKKFITGKSVTEKKYSKKQRPLRSSQKNTEDNEIVQSGYPAGRAKSRSVNGAQSMITAPQTDQSRLQRIGKSPTHHMCSCVKLRITGT